MTSPIFATLSLDNVKFRKVTFEVNYITDLRFHSLNLVSLNFTQHSFNQKWCITQLFGSYKCITESLALQLNEVNFLVTSHVCNNRKWCHLNFSWFALFFPTLTDRPLISKENRLLKFYCVPATSATSSKAFSFFLLRQLTVLMNQTRKAVCTIKQPILLRCLYDRYTLLVFVCQSINFYFCIFLELFHFCSIFLGTFLSQLII